VLKAIGPPAEAAVCAYLKNGDASARTEAANILGEIGGEASVPDLGNLARSGSGPDVDAARGALKAMAARGVNLEAGSP
jgi:HEAT repeat protein